MTDTSRRQQLLDAAIDHVARHGLSDLSLRQLAGELGTSHRMLIHHFGSKEGLWVAIVRDVEQRQIAAMDDLLDPTLPFDEAMRVWWRHISDPSMWPSERLFFEVYSQGLHGTGPASELLDGIVESWLEPVTEQLVASGVPRPEARASARLGLAVTRGLLLDLVATEDRVGVDAAMERWIELNR